MPHSAPMEDLQGDRKPRVRAKKPKTRTGCQTCKLRRVKCDERRPKCQRCVSAGRDCAGYDITISQIDRNRHTLVLPRSVLITQPQSLSNLTASESRGLDFFRSVTVRQIPGCFRFDHLAHTILSVSYCEPSLLHAAIAVGSVHQTFAKAPLPISKFGPDSSTSFALQQYNKAIQHLNVRLSKAIDRSTRELVLMNCTLFVCFDILSGRRASAVTHIANGLRIACEDLPKGQEKPTFHSKNHPGSITANLTANLARMSVQSMVFGEFSPTYMLLGQRSLKYLGSNLSTSFSTLLEAKQELCILSSPVFRLRWQAFMTNFLSSRNIGKRLPMNRSSERAIFTELATSKNDTPLSEQYLELRARLTTWSVALDSYIALLDASVSTEDLMATKILRAQSIGLSVLLDTWQSDKETVWDQFEPQFEMIGSLGREYLAVAPTPDRGESSPDSHPFCMDLGIVSVLQFSASKCRDPTIRRQLLSLIRQIPCQDGMLNSHIYATMIDRIIALEEAGAIHGITVAKSEDVPESARFHGAILRLADNDQDSKLRLMRFEHEKNGAWCEREESLLPG